MINTKRLIMYVGIAFGIVTTPLHATLIGVSDPTSSMGTAAQIIAAPTNILDDLISNTGMQGFDEAQGVTTSVAHAIDSGGEISAGTVVNSHMIFLNSSDRTYLEHLNVNWTFADIILGVMSDRSGNLEAASTFELGAPGTNYTTPFLGSGPAAPFGARGFEGRDIYSFIDNILTVSMFVTEPGDWIRVITEASAVPEPSPLALMSLGLAAIGFASRKKKLA